MANSIATVSPCPGLHSKLQPFRPLGSAKPRVVRAAASKRALSSPLPASLAGILMAAPAWADDVVSSLQQGELPSQLPSPQEIVEKVPQTGGSALDLFADNPVIVVGLLFLAAIPLALNFLGGGALGAKQVNAAGALEGLSSDPSTVLIDIRSREEAKDQGSPNLSSTKKKAIVLPFTRLVGGEPEEISDFVDKFSKLKQIKSDASIIILDSYGKEAPKAAKLLAKLAGRVYYVQGGAVGLNGWKESGQPWREPVKSLLNLDSLAEDFKAQPTIAKAGVAAGAVGLAAAVLFQEAGTVLELAAVAAAGAFALPSFLPKASAEELGEGTQKQQVKQFVSAAKKDISAAASKVEDEVEKEAPKAAGFFKKEAPKAAAKVEKEAPKAAGFLQQEVPKAAAKVEKEASKLVGKAEEKAPKAADKVEKEAPKIADKIEKEVQLAGQQVNQQAEKAANTDLGAEAKSAANKAKESVQQATDKPAQSAQKVEKKAEKAVEKGTDKAKDAASDLSKAADKNAQEAQSWIENWRKENSDV